MSTFSVADSVSMSMFPVAVIVFNSCECLVFVQGSDSRTSAAGIDVTHVMFIQSNSVNWHQFVCEQLLPTSIYIKISNSSERMKIVLYLK